MGHRKTQRKRTFSGASPALAAAFLGDEDPSVRGDAERVYAALGHGDDELSEARF